jgi:transposase-like protein
VGSDVTCPRCGSDTVKKGYRNNVSGRKGILFCKRCNCRFVEETQGSFPKHHMMEALSQNTLGYNSAEINTSLRKRFKIAPSRSTIQRWIQTHSDLTPIAKKREEIRSFGDPIKTLDLVHRGIPYSFAVNMFKAQYLKNEMAGLKNYLTCYEDKPVFEGGDRCSDKILSVSVETKRTKNIACRIAGLAFESAKKSTDRHSLVERFMLVNDSATIATEVPIYFYLKEKGSITGHIDLLQVRFGKVHILDLKPDANKEHPEAQLLSYAMGLSFRTGIPLKSIECAWFDEKDYFSFAASEAKWN